MGVRLLAEAGYDPMAMSDFNVLTFNSKAFPGTAPLVVSPTASSTVSVSVTVRPPGMVDRVKASSRYRHPCPG